MKRNSVVTAGMAASARDSEAVAPEPVVTVAIIESRIAGRTHGIGA
jgi:hypothetical protein